MIDAHYLSHSYAFLTPHIILGLWIPSWLISGHSCSIEYFNVLVAGQLPSTIEESPHMIWNYPRAMRMSSQVAINSRLRKDREAGACSGHWAGPCPGNKTCSAGYILSEVAVEGSGGSMSLLLLCTLERGVCPLDRSISLSQFLGVW